jgi:molybdopterin biosynthesis enzyme
MAVRGARLQPGRPIQVGRAPSGTILIALPGNPVSALVIAHLFIWPIIRAMISLVPRANEPGVGASDPPLPSGEGLGGRALSMLPWRTHPLAAPVKPNTSRQAFRPAILNGDGSITIPKWAGSGDLVHTAPTHGIAALPEQAAEVSAGTRVPFLAWA